ncbi:MAG: YdcH family protein [Erythrobacter sp.]
MASSTVSSAANSHVNALQSKHAGLEARLRAEMARPQPDTAMIQTLKRKKLRLKEEIART